MKTLSQEEKFHRAKRKVTRMKKFYSELISYVLVISLLAGINYYTNEWRYAWFLWAAFGWGIGLAFKATKAFNLNPFFGKNWEERKIQEFMQDEAEKKRWE